MLALNYPYALVREAWLEWRHTKRFFDSSEHPMYWDVRLRADVYVLDAYWEYELAWKRHGASGDEGGEGFETDPQKDEL